MGSCLKLYFIVSSSAGDSVHVGLPETRPLPYLPYRLKFKFLKKQLVHLFILLFAFCICLSSLQHAPKRSALLKTRIRRHRQFPLSSSLRSGQVRSAHHRPLTYRTCIVRSSLRIAGSPGRGTDGAKKKFFMIRAPIGFIVLKREGASSFSPLAERILSIPF